MNLNLKKSIVFFDLETTGLDISSSKIIEISLLKINIDNSEEILTKRINPEISIPPETTKIHGITNKDVADKPYFKDVAQEILKFIGNSDLGGYNILRFDLPLLAEEFLRHDIMFEINNRSIIDVQNIFHKMEPRTLSGAYKFYCNKKLKNAHSAEADIKATYEVLLSQIEKYKDAPYEEKDKEVFPIINNIKALGDFSIQKKFFDLAGHIVLDDKDIAVFNFGKYKNQSVEEVFNKEPQYFDWIMKSNFPEYTKRTFKLIYMKKFDNNSNVKFL